MENEGKLAGYVEELLGMHHCITIAGLGSFIFRDSPASANVFSMEIKPSGKTIFFNNAITADDGILVNKIRESRGLSYNQALDFVNAEASVIRAHLHGHRNFAFGTLGNFFLNAEGQIFFLPAANLNLSHDSYGLPVLKLAAVENMRPNEVEKTDTVKVVNILADDKDSYDEADVVHLEEKEMSKRRGILFRAAAIFVIVTLAATGIYFSTHWFQNSNQASIQANVVKSNPTPSKKSDETSSYGPIDTENSQEFASTETTTIAELPAFVNADEFLKSLVELKGTYFVLGGMYMDENLAAVECSHWNGHSISAAAYKPKGSSLFKVVLGRFTNEKEASEFAGKLPEFTGANISVRQIDLMK